jgi:hypothetical protein
VLGAVVALVVYVFIRATVVSSSVPAESLNYYGIVAISFLSGTFSRNVVAKLTEIFDILFGTGSRPRGGTLEANTLSEMQHHTLARFRGYIVYAVNTVGIEELGQVISPRDDVTSDLGNRRTVRLWLQQKSHPTFPSLAVDVGEGAQPKKVAFRVNAFSEQCEIEPRQGQLLAERDTPQSNSLMFVLHCPAGVERPDTYFELSQRGRTVAVVSLFTPETPAPQEQPLRRQAGPGIGRP